MIAKKKLSIFAITIAVFISPIILFLTDSEMSEV
jgi:DNA repair photolyase